MPKRFSDIKDLSPVLDSGVELVFMGFPSAFGRCLPLTSPWVVEISTSFHPSVPAEEILFSQKETLIHEFLHLYNGDPKKDRGRFEPDPEGIVEGLYEQAVEEQTGLTLKRHPELVKEIVKELSLRPNCSIVYDDRETPFFFYHRLVIHELLAEFRGDPERREKLSQLAQVMDC